MRTRAGSDLRIYHVFTRRTTFAILDPTASVNYVQKKQHETLKCKVVYFSKHITKFQFTKRKNSRFGK